MKTLQYIGALALGAMAATSCVDDFKVGDAFLEKAPGVDVNMDTVFTKGEYVKNFLWTAYGQLYCTYTSGNCMNGAPIDNLSDSWQCYCGWGGPKQSYYAGNLGENAQDTDDGNMQGRFAYSTHNYHSSSASGRVSIYETVRKCWQIIENVDRVPDLSAEEKSQLKGEAYVIIASRYFDAFRNFGGLCLVDHAYAVGEDFKGGRSTAMQTVEFIDALIQKAIDEPGLPWNVEDVTNWSGRLTEASARALRCKLWMHAASPLFNDDQPYMQYEDSKVTEFTNIEHVWFGKKDPALWQKCLDACNEFFAENEKHGNYYQLVMPTGDDEAAYRKAYRTAYRERNNGSHTEKIFDAQPTYNMGSSWGWQGFAMDCVRQGGMVPTNELMEAFGMADGRVYPYAYGEADIYGPGKNPSGIDIFENRDPRLYETLVVPRQRCNQVEDYQGLTDMQTWVGGYLQKHDAFKNQPDNCRSGYVMYKWVLDLTDAKITQTPVGFAYIRLAEVYLIRAEALAETGNLTAALKDLNLIRSRVGLGDIEKMNPQLNLTTNKDNFIAQLMRERNCEIGAECGDRFYDMVRRKLEHDFTKPLHEMKVYRLDADGNRVEEGINAGDPWPKYEYECPVVTVGARRWWEPGYWTNKWYLDPLSRIEIQKAYGLTQNPGW